MLVVRLHGQDVGEIVRFDNGRIQFEFYPEYAARRNRPTLSQSFLDEYGNIIGGGNHTISGELPVFFSNLLPEGRLRTYLAAKAGFRETREFELLELLGHDLPGAVEVVREHRTEDGTRATQAEPTRRSSVPPDALRFSLAGVQLKLSALMDTAGDLTLPARGMGGNWILKPPSFHHDGVPENEFSMMELARRVGIEVPETRLVPMKRIKGLPPELVEGRLANANALAVRRYDRTEGKRIHAEDFAQTFGLRPNEKYERYTYADFARVLAAISDERSISEFSKRLMHAALVANGDLHAKNWSLIYRDARTPELSPAYDLLCTTAHIANDDMALRLGSARRWKDLTLDDFADVADAAHIDCGSFVSMATETAERFRDIWQEASKSLPIRDNVKAAIKTQLATVPAITGSWRARHWRGRGKAKASD